MGTTKMTFPKKSTWILYGLNCSRKIRQSGKIQTVRFSTLSSALFFFTPSSQDLNILHQTRRKSQIFLFFCFRSQLSHTLFSPWAVEHRGRRLECRTWSASSPAGWQRGSWNDLYWEWKLGTPSRATVNSSFWYKICTQPYVIAQIIIHNLFPRQYPLQESTCHNHFSVMSLTWQILIIIKRWQNVTWAAISAIGISIPKKDDIWSFLRLLAVSFAPYDCASSLLDMKIKN